MDRGAFGLTQKAVDELRDIIHRAYHPFGIELTSLLTASPPGRLSRRNLLQKQPY